MSRAAPVLDITEEDFNSWKHHPVTKVYLRYVLDYATEARRALADRVCGAEMSLDQFATGKLSGQANAWQEIAALEFSHIASFYSPPQEETQEGEHDT